MAIKGDKVKYWLHSYICIKIPIDNTANCKFMISTNDSFDVYEQITSYIISLFLHYNIKISDGFMELFSHQIVNKNFYEKIIEN